MIRMLSRIPCNDGMNTSVDVYGIVVTVHESDTNGITVEWTTNDGTDPDVALETDYAALACLENYRQTGDTEYDYGVGLDLASVSGWDGNDAYGDQTREYLRANS